MNRTQGWLGFILAASLIASMLMHQIYAGAYMRSTPAGNFTYFIGVVSTSIPFAFWALITFSVSLIGRARANHYAALICGYFAGWFGMTTFTFWIVTWPRTYGHSASMAIAVALTAATYAAIFPVLFPFGYLIARVLFHWKPGAKRT